MSVSLSDLRRKLHSLGYSFQDLEISLSKKGTKISRLKKLRIRDNYETIPCFTLTNACFEGGVFNVSRATLHPKRDVTPSIVKNYVLTASSVVIPAGKVYVGAFHFISNSKHPVFAGQNMLFIQCPDIVDAVTLSIWMSDKDVVAYINSKLFDCDGSLYNQKDILFKLPVPVEPISKLVLIQAIKYSKKALEKSKEIQELLQKKSDLSFEKLQKQ